MVMTIGMGLYAATMAGLGVGQFVIMAARSALSPQLVTLQRNVVLTTVVLYYLNALLAAIWNFLISGNAHTIKRSMQNSRWATLYWVFVPIAFLFKPFEVMREIWQVSGGDKTAAWVKTWWALFLISHFAQFTANLTAKFDPGGMTLPVAGVVNLIAASSTVVFLVMANQMKTLQLNRHSIVDVFGDEPAPQTVLNFT